MHSSLTIDETFQRALQERIFSGAQVLAGQDLTRKFEGFYGHLSWDPGEAAVGPGTWFDVASLTKPLVTTVLAFRAVQTGNLLLEAPVRQYLPGFNRGEAITVRHLLEHTSGLPDWLPLYEEFKQGHASREKVQTRYIARINEVPLEAPPGDRRCYSDLGFLLLGFLLEGLEEQSLDSLYEQRLVPLWDLHQSGFNPLKRGVSAEVIAATEEGDWRGKRLRGEVHDDNAYPLAGVAGHAGLFATANDVEKIIHGIWRIWEEPGLQAFIGPQVHPKLGWDTPSSSKSQAGQYFGKHSFGHLAFTGCSLWLDPQDRKYLILLTNRVHPNRRNKAIKEFRPLIHDRIIEQLGLHP